MKRDKNQDSPYALVYSTDPVATNVCKTCGKPLGKCNCESVLAEATKKLNPKIRFERKGRGGKSVTVVSRLPPSESFLKALCKYLKQAVGSGGTSYLENSDGVIEIQGEWQNELPALIAKYKVE